MLPPSKENTDPNSTWSINWEAFLKASRPRTGAVQFAEVCLRQMELISASSAPSWRAPQLVSVLFCWEMLQMHHRVHTSYFITCSNGLLQIVSKTLMFRTVWRSHIITRSPYSCCEEGAGGWVVPGDQQPTWGPMFPSCHRKRVLLLTLLCDIS